MFQIHGHLCFLYMESFSFLMQHPGQIQVSLLVSWAGGPRFIYIEVSVPTPYFYWLRAQVDTGMQVSSHRFCLFIKNQTHSLWGCCIFRSPDYCFGSQIPLHLLHLWFHVSWAMIFKNTFCYSLISHFWILLLGAVLNYSTFSVTNCYITNHPKL